MLDNELLRSFIAVVDSGSFTRAAAQLFRTQSAVSMQMKRLEEQLDKKLFLKDGRELQLSDDGLKLLSYARRIMKLHDEALGVMSSTSDSCPLMLGCPDDYVTGVLPQLLSEIQRQIPGLQVQVRTGTSAQLRALIDKGELDLTILTRRPETEEGYLLLQDQGVWVAPTADFIKPEQPLRLALVDADCKFHSTAVDGLSKQGRNFDVICISGSCALLIELVRRGEAITTLASCCVPADLYRLPAELGLPELATVAVVLQSAARPHKALGADRIVSLVEQTALRLSV
ncbi:LysR substrate-binding domain-containing protein [Amphritea sp. 2_MG-2023]|jgi:DNA-binding transcriptional LysR family regulator|uniref:LysR family transcriptional regulator n=1 Tax=Amphritea TaxID=515417 RepID=UPI001C077451|nr:MULTISPECIES: LysR family transcriptional regulator [Amphritea]MBU2965683.1 LysR family transcriptional regulator [Amphritea atlantica]MDO6417239.1 LysR substrate-binding domain-containing protein [Amphritea sp. 2_MG-2023]